MKSPSPKDLLRIAVLACFLGAVATIPVAGRRATTDEISAQYIRDLGMMFFSAMWIFGLFYVQYRLIERYSRRTLDLLLGYVQVGGCLIYLLFAALSLFGAMRVDVLTPSDAWLEDHALIFLCAFGEIVFIVNVARSYMHDVAPVSKPRFPDKPAPTWGWPRSPVVLFGSTAGLIVALGLVFMLMNIGSQLGSHAAMPAVVGGQFRWFPASYLCFAAAVPFAIFALGYSAAERKLMQGRPFQGSATRLHFFCTFLVLFELVHVYQTWAISLTSSLAPHLDSNDTVVIFSVFALACGAFLWNVRVSQRTV